MEFKYWLLAVGVVVAMSYVSVEGAHAACPGGNVSFCTANETCNSSSNYCVCKAAYKEMSDDSCVARGYDDSCTANTDCQSGNLGDKGLCKNTTNKCGCMTGYSWTASMCKSDNGAAGLTISITLMLGALLSKKIF